MSCEDNGMSGGDQICSEVVKGGDADGTFVGFQPTEGNNYIGSPNQRCDQPFEGSANSIGQNQYGDCNVPSTSQPICENSPLSPFSPFFPEENYPGATCINAENLPVYDPQKFNMPYNVQKHRNRIPESEYPIRGPQRPWRQCVENELINDQVRRPMARQCFKRETPVVISRAHYENLKFKTIERELQRQEEERRRVENENKKMQSYQRKTAWGHTVDSLLTQKRNRECEKARLENESNQKFLDEAKEGKRIEDQETLSRAKKQMLYRKGLVKDFHSAMSYSKMLQDIDQERQILQTKEDEKKMMLNDKFLWDSRCMKRMINSIKTSDNKTINPVDKKNRPLDPRLIERMKQEEIREQARKQELQNEINSCKNYRTENLPELPEAYKKYLEDQKPVCMDEETKRKIKNEKNAKERVVRLEEMQNKVLINSFIESHEREIERQACEFNKHKDALREHEKELIESRIKQKVHKTTMCAEKTAELLQRRLEQERQYGRRGQSDCWDCGGMNENYISVREQWEQDWASQRKEKMDELERRRELAREDYIRRQNLKEKQQNLDDGKSIEFAQKHLNSREMDLDGVRRKNEAEKARELAEYHKCQMEERHNRKMSEKEMNDAWAAKMEREYENEMNEMKSYASNCIQDWKEKGRDIRPMLHAMKKWDCEGNSIGSYNSRNFCKHGAQVDMCACKYQDQEEVSAVNYNTPPRNYESSAMRCGFANSGT